jgi:hypothetical protein
MGGIGSQIFAASKTNRVKVSMGLKLAADRGSTKEDQAILPIPRPRETDGVRGSCCAPTRAQ